MSSRVLIQHLSGSRIDQEDAFPATESAELILGREADCHIRYDQDRDDLVSRRHARLSIVPGDVATASALQVTLTDLNSANGLFVNGAQVSGSVPLAHGDLVRLGAEGPEFLFKLDPPPGQLSRATRVISRHEAPAAVDKATRIVTREDLLTHAAPAPAPVAAKPVSTASVASVPVAVGTTGWGQRRIVVAVAAVVAAIGLSGGAYVLAKGGTTASAPARPGPSSAAGTTTGTPPAPQPTLRANEVAERYSKSVVMIRASWSLRDPRTQRPLYHKLGTVTGKDGVRKVVPYYIRRPDGRVLPWVVLEPTSADGVDQRAIGGTGQGTGFVATENGFVVTNRHVAAHWLESYEGPEGLLFQDDGSGQTRLLGVSNGKTDWVPGRDRMGGKSEVASVTSRYEVQFENDETTVSADLVSTSDKHDVSIIRVNRPFALRRVEMKDTYDTLRRGDRVVVMGYPSVAAPGIIFGNDKGNGQQTAAVRPSVMLTEGAIGNIHRPTTTAADGSTQVNPLGDVYQLTINSTGAGNSGGPVFNERGEVVAIFFAGLSSGGATTTLAVPIRYALALLGDNAAR